MFSSGHFSIKRSLFFYLIINIRVNYPTNGPFFGIKGKGYPD